MSTDLRAIQPHAPPLIPAAPALAPARVGYVTCPLCHTADATMTNDAIHDAGANWQCARCGQRWDAIRLATAAAYAVWLSRRAT